jgi:hypothetical protein
MTRGDTIQSMRRLADFLEFHSDIPLPRSFGGQLHIGDPSEFKRAAEEMRRHGATVEVVGSYVVVTMTLGMGVTITVQTGVNPLLGDRPAPDKTERVMAELEKP